MFNAVLTFLKTYKSRKIRSQIEESGYFDRNFYLNSNQDVADGQYEPLFHFIYFGAAEGRSPSEAFDVQAYYRDNPEALASGLNPIVDWLTLGPKGLRRPPVAIQGVERRGNQQAVERDRQGEPQILDLAIKSDAVPAVSILNLRERLIDAGLFDEEYYLSANDDVKAAGADAFQHYVHSGHQENRNPSAEFDTYYYATQNAGGISAEAPAAALIDFLERGQYKGLKGRPANSLTLMPCAEFMPSAKIAVHIHLFYPEYAEKFAQLLSNLKFDFDLFVSVCSAVDAIFVKNIFLRITPERRTTVKTVENRGRDIAPFLLSFPEIWSDFDFVLHLHSKRSPHTGFGAKWSDWIFRNILSDPNITLAALRHIEENPNLAMLFPDNYRDIKRFAGWGGNEGRSRALLARFGFEDVEFPAHPHFAAGSMAWFRTKPFASFIDKIGIDDFETEDGQVEGTLAHVLERLLPFYITLTGYDVATYYLAKVPRLPNFDQTHPRIAGSDSVGKRWMRDTPKIAATSGRQLKPLTNVHNPRALEISWIIPDFALGAGGHMTIFRIIEFLESFGHRQTIWIQNAHNYPDPQIAKTVINRHYRKIGERVAVRFLPDDVRQLSGDALIATDCWTVFPASATVNFKERFYFIQDYEPYFHPVGENYIIAESTYRMGFAALCAGDWLLKKATDHGMWARKWDLASDEEFYYPAATHSMGAVKRRITKIAFYNRGYTPRRAVNLGLAAFEELSTRRRDFQVLMFGQPPENRSHSFAYQELGICTPEKLGEIYRSADIGVAFSTTNYSLIPLEMMACGLAVVEIDAESTRTAFPEGAVTLAPPNPSAIADAIERLIDDGVARSEQTSTATTFVSNLNWRKSALAVEAAILERLQELGSKSIDPDVITKPAFHHKLKASVVIPTYNGGKLFREVIDRVAAQNTDFRYDILVVDSSSKDGTAQYVRDKLGSDRLHIIDKSQFQHGRTRNLAISMTEGEIAAVLTQDSMPADENWLARLVAGFDISPRIAGAIGRHRAYDEHNLLVARDLNVMFDRFADLGPVFELDRGLPSFIPRGCFDWRMIMHFYSDNNSAIRRAVWRELPYPDVEWGEDHIWAWEALKLGFAKVYVDNAVVLHSHDFSVSQQVAVSASEGKMFAEYFGYDLHPDGWDLAQLDEIERRERLFATKAGVSQTAASRYVRLIKASVEGRMLGAASVGDDR